MNIKTLLDESSGVTKGGLGGAEPPQVRSSAPPKLSQSGQKNLGNFALKMKSEPMLKWMLNCQNIAEEIFKYWLNL